MTVPAWLNWALAGASLMLLVGYEWRAHRVGSREPHRMARYANARLRTQWVRALSAQPGYEIVAVQALRNSQMSGVTLVAGIEHWSRS